MVGPSPPRKQPPAKSNRRSFSYRRSKAPPERPKTEPHRSISTYLQATNARLPKAQSKPKHPPNAEGKASKKRPPGKWLDRSRLSYIRDPEPGVGKNETVRAKTIESPQFPCWNIVRFPELPPSNTPCSAARIAVPASSLPDRAFRSAYHKTPSKHAAPRDSAALQRLLFLPADCRSPPPLLLQQWNQELTAITQYIQLTPEEMQLRQSFLDRLQEQFLAAQQKRAQVFGSFATTPICTFQSDLDVALWDVLPEVVLGTSAGAETTAAPRAVTGSSAKTSDPPAVVPALRVEKWKLALAAVEDHEGSTATSMAPTSTSSSEVAELENGAAAKDPRPVASSARSDPIDLTNEDDNNAIESNFADGITLDYCGEEVPLNDDDSSSDEDSADPMTLYENRPILPNPTGSERQLDASMHVSWYASSKPLSPPPPAASWNHPHPMPAYRKAQVVDTLSALCSSLRKKAHRRDMAIQHITLIKTAKVPIIKIQTTHGFPVDIAVGGFGTDTSLYAQKQMARYPYSFVPVVIVLKTLLAQHRLDEPYTGGLGSYKLYILVAHHINMHLQQQKDTQDRECYPFVMLYTFLYRYGYGQEDEQRSWKRKKLSEHSITAWSYPTTPLCQYVPFTAQDGVGSSTCADLSNVYKLKECLSLFRTCFQRLNDQMHNAVSQPAKSENATSPPQPSLLAHVICPWQLQQDRERVLAKTQWSATAAMTRPATAPRPDSDAQRRPKGKPSNALEQVEDRTLEEIVAGYGIRVEDLTSP